MANLKKTPPKEELEKGQELPKSSIASSLRRAVENAKINQPEAEQEEDDQDWS